MLRYDENWIAGERYRTWIRSDAKRFKLLVSRKLLEDLCPSTPEAALDEYAESFLRVAQWKIDELMTETSDGITWLQLGQKDEQRIRHGVAYV